MIDDLLEKIFNDTTYIKTLEGFTFTEYMDKKVKISLAEDHIGLLSFIAVIERDDKKVVIINCNPQESFCRREMFYKANFDFKNIFELFLSLIPAFHMKLCSNHKYINSLIKSNFNKTKRIINITSIYLNYEKELKKEISEKDAEKIMSNILKVDKCFYNDSVSEFDKYFLINYFFDGYARDIFFREIFKNLKIFMKNGFFSLKDIKDVLSTLKIPEKKYSEHEKMFLAIFRINKFHGYFSKDMSISLSKKDLTEEEHSLFLRYSKF